MLIEYYLKQAGNCDDAKLRVWNMGVYRQKNIADYFSIHYSQVSKILKRQEKRTFPFFILVFLRQTVTYCID